MSRGDDIRIYYGDARFIIPTNDPRAADILAMCVSPMPKPETKGPAPRNDAEFIQMVVQYVQRRPR